MSSDSSFPAPDPSATTDERSLFDRCYRGILRAIYEEAFVPGQRLAAPDLMQQFSVGRGTIREVLHRLASAGVVSIVPNRGAQVRLLSRAEVFSLLDIVQVLLGLAARGAAIAVATGQGAQQISDRRRALHDAARPGDFSAFARAREQFYREVVRLSGNTELPQLFPDAQVHIMRVQLRRFQNAADSLAEDDFEALADAILGGDEARAERAAHEHVDMTRQRILPLPDQAFARIAR